MGALYNLLIHNPLVNILVFFYNTIAFEDLGLAIIFLTILIRLLLFPIFQKTARYQMLMQKLQPKIRKIQETHKDSKQKQGEAMMALYKDHKVNPFSGILFLIIQLPILIALYSIFLSTLKPGSLTGLYSFVNAPEGLNTTFLGLISLGQSNILIAGLAAIGQYFQGKLSLIQGNSTGGGERTMAEKIGRQMVFVGPALTLIILINLPSALGLYWLTTSIFSILQQIIVNKQIANGELGKLREQDN